MHPRPDPRLLNIWADLQGFAAAANQATSFGMKMPSSLFIDVTSSAPYRLTHLELDQGSLAELLRLCMLAFLKTILTNIVGLGRHLTYLAGGLKGALLAQRHVHEPELNELLFWALFLTALAVFEDHDRDWIREMLEEEAAALGLRTWGDAGAVLKRYLWVDLVFEDTGEQLFNEWLGSQELPIDGSCETGSVGWS